MSVVVTGAGNGIGAAIARMLAARGHRVAVTDRDLAAARAVAQECTGAEAFELDVTEPASIAAAAQASADRLGPLEAWVSNAGVSSMNDFVDLTREEIDLQFEVNAKGPLLCGQVAARLLIEQGRGGAIVNIASMAGQQGAVPYLAHYVASKFAVVGLTQAMAHELGAHGIRVNSVCPGFVATGMQERELAWEAELRDTTPEQVELGWVGDTPLGRVEEADDVARCVCFLVSDDARFVTGEALAVNGGAFMS